MCRFTGLDIDGLYRVSGNLAIIQKLRFKADHGKADLCLTQSFSQWLHMQTKWRIQSAWMEPLQYLTAVSSAPCCALISCAPVVFKQRNWTWRTASGRTFMSSLEHWSCFSESFLSRFFHTATLIISSQPSVSRWLNTYIWFEHPEKLCVFGQIFKSMLMMQMEIGWCSLYL